MRFLVATAVAGLAVVCALGARADEPGIAGYWRDPTGTVIRIASCGQVYCARIVKLTPDAPSTTDSKNPKADERGRALCGLVIGQGFHLTGTSHAEGGSLYDPRTGNTYTGEMTSNGDTLNLRGYVGLKIFGRSETWHRTAPSGNVCSAS